MKNRTIKLDIPLTNKVLEIDEGLVFPLVVIVPVCLVLGALALFGVNGTIGLCALFIGYTFFQGISLKNKPEE